VGRVAAQAQVKTVVLSHLVPGDDPDITNDMWSEGVRERFKGRVIVGKDLMEICGWQLSDIRGLRPPNSHYSGRLRRR
jgi:hypothetical protein